MVRPRIRLPRARRLSRHGWTSCVNVGEDDPLFQNWDQDETAVNERYGEQDPATVVNAQLAIAADQFAQRVARHPARASGHAPARDRTAATSRSRRWCATASTICSTINGTSSRD